LSFRLRLVHFCADARSKYQLVAVDTRGIAIQIERFRQVLGDAKTLLVQIAQIDARTTRALRSGLFEPLRRLRVVGIGTQAFQIDLADVVLRFHVPGFRLALPDLQRGLIVGAIVSDIFTAANLTIGLRRAHRTARTHERGGSAEFAHLPRQQAVDDQQIFGVACLHGCRSVGYRRCESE
jgi:hypothetical protein